MHPDQIDAIIQNNLSILRESPEDQMALLSLSALMTGPKATVIGLAMLVASLKDNAPVDLGYRDEDGVVSLRNATVNAIERTSQGNVIIRAYDHQREDHRSFRLDRILFAL